MGKLIKFTILLFALSIVFQAGKMWEDKCTLRENLIRLHVVANSDSAEDQELKLRVKDAVVAYLDTALAKFNECDDAFQFLQEHLGKIEQIAGDILLQEGIDEKVTVSLGEEEFNTRKYDTFSLPAGVYQSLRISLGSGEGKNWWCVAFPSLCQSTATSFSDVATSAGFDTELTQTIENNGEYELRFYFLDCIGRLENLFTN